jgi:AraC family transcriptional activator of pobA
MKKHIPVNKIQDRADLSLEVGHTTDDGVQEMLETLDVHRDDSYIFLLIEKGEGSAIVDFVEVFLPAGHIYYIAPGQVHHRIRTNGGEASFVSVAADMVPKNYREVFEGNLLLQQPCQLAPDELKSCQSMVHLLYDQFRKDREAPFYHQLMQSLLHSFLCLFASVYATSDIGTKRTLRPFQITQQFKRLLSEKIGSEKSPSFYAEALHISEIYLNEAVKSVTGFNVTHWLMNEVMLEAKRLLTYSQANVKEIAWQLGYADHAYFSRLFKKQTSLTPSEFRDNYLK